MFLVSTDNKLFYRGENKARRGGIGTSNTPVVEYTEVSIIDDNGDNVDISNLVDYVELASFSLFLFSDGSVYGTTSTGIKKIVIDNIIQVATTDGTDGLLLNSNGELYKILQNHTFSRVTKVYSNKVQVDIPRIVDIHSTTNYARISSIYGSSVIVDENCVFYTYGYDVTSNSSRLYFSEVGKNMRLACGLSYSSASYSTFSTIDTKGIHRGYGNINGNGRQFSSYTTLEKFDRNFKTYNTNVNLYTVDIVGIIGMYNNLSIIYRENNTLKYAVTASTSSHISGETIACGNKFQEIIPNENNINFERFEPELLVDSTYVVLYAFEKETGDLYMAGEDGSTGSSVITPLTKVILPDGRKVKRLTKSKSYHDFAKSLPSIHPVATVSMFKDGAFNQNDSGIKIWDGSNYDRALFVDELEGKYELDLAKGEPHIKIQTSNGERILASTEMIIAPIVNNQR